MAEFAQQHQFSVFTSSKESQKGVLCAQGSQSFSSLWAEHFAMLRTRDLVAWWFWPSFAHHLLIICHIFWRPNHTKPTCLTSLSHAPCLKTSACCEVVKFRDWFRAETSGLHLTIHQFDGSSEGKNHGKSILVFGYGLIPRYVFFFVIFPFCSPVGLQSWEPARNFQCCFTGVISLSFADVLTESPTFSLRTALTLQGALAGNIKVSSKSSLQPTFQWHVL